MFVPLCVFHQNPKIATHIFKISAVEKNPVKDAINSKLIPKVSMIRGSISALALTHTARLLSYSLLVSDFASWTLLCSFLSRNLSQPRPGMEGRVELWLSHRTRVCRLSCFEVFFKHLFEMFGRCFSLVTTVEKSVTQDHFVRIIKLQEKWNFRIRECCAVCKRWYMSDVGKKWLGRCSASKKFKMRYPAYQDCLHTVT